jgi:N-acetylneuraminic acid mutarotase
MNKILRSRLLLLLGVFLLTASCEKEEPDPKGIPDFSVTSVSPDSAYEEEAVHILGEGFRTTAAENTVKFNGVEATVESATDTSLSVVVPKGARSGKVTVTIDGFTKSSENDFTRIPLPFIHSLSIWEGYIGSSMIIYGANFRENPSENEVEFNGVPVEEIKEGSRQHMWVIIPEGATTGKVSVTVNGKTAYTTSDFILKTDYWILKNGTPFYRLIGGIAFSIGNKGYVGLGVDHGVYTSSFWEYDPATDSWSQKADFPGETRFDAVGFAADGKGYVGTGITEEEGILSDFWEYDPATDSWTQKADFPGTSRYDAVGFAVSEKGYVGTGRNGSSEHLADLWEYNPVADSWNQKADFPGGHRIGAVGFAIGNKGYFGTGKSTGSEYHKDFWEYDPVADSWTQKADLAGNPRSDAVAFSIENNGYIGLGATNSTMVWPGEFLKYDPATDEWSKVNKIKEIGGTSFSGVAFSIGNKGYSGMGSASSQNSSLWEYSLK